MLWIHAGNSVGNSVSLLQISDYSELRTFVLLTPPYQWVARGCRRSWDATQLGQLNPTDQRDIPYYVMSCSAYKAGGRLAEDSCPGIGWEWVGGERLFVICITCLSWVVFLSLLFSHQPYSLLAVSLGTPLDCRKHIKKGFLYAYLTYKVIYHIGGETKVTNKCDILKDKIAGYIYSYWHSFTLLLLYSLSWHQGIFYMWLDI